MNGKIKIALCLSGEPRSSMFCFPYIYESFINLGPEYEVDVYIHTLKPYRAMLLYNAKVYNFEPFNYFSWAKYLNEKLSLPKELKESLDFYNNYTSQTNFILNQLLMVDGIQKSFNLLPTHSPPDIVIRCRPDIFTDSKIDIGNIIHDIIKGDYDIFIHSKPINSNKVIKERFYKEYSDQFAIGNYSSMAYYSNMFNNLNFLLNDTKEWRAEAWLKSQLDYYKIKVNSYYIPFNLIRRVNIASNRGPKHHDISYLDL